MDTIESFVKYSDDLKGLLETYDRRPTKVGATRVRKVLDAMCRLKVEAKREIKRHAEENIKPRKAKSTSDAEASTPEPQSSESVAESSSPEPAKKKVVRRKKVVDEAPDPPSPEVKEESSVSTVEFGEPVSEEKTTKKVVRRKVVKKKTETSS